MSTRCHSGCHCQATLVYHLHVHTAHLLVFDNRLLWWEWRILCMLFGDMSDRMRLDQFRHVFLKIVQSKCYRQSLAALLLSSMYINGTWKYKHQRGSKPRSPTANFKLQIFCILWLSRLKRRKTKRRESLPWPWKQNRNIHRSKEENLFVAILQCKAK